MSSYTSSRWNFFIGFSLHDAIVLTSVPPLPVKYWPHLSIGIASGTQLFSMWTEQKGAEILMDGQHFLGRGSDAVPVVPHIDMVQGWNPVLPWNIVFGSSNSVWGTGGVTIATYSPIFGKGNCDLACSPLSNQAITFNLSCTNPVSFVLDFTFMWGTVRSGFTTADFLACLIDIALEIAMDVVSKFGFKILGKAAKGGKAAFKKVATKTSAYMAERALKKAAQKVVKEAAEEAAQAAAKKLVKEAAEEATESFASKVGRNISESFKSGLAKLRKPASNALSNADEAADPSMLSKAWKASKEGSQSAYKYVSTKVTGAAAWKKAAEARYLENGQFFRYIALSKGFKYGKKAVNMGIDLSSIGQDVDQDESAANYQFFVWNLGSREGVYDNLEGSDGDSSDGGTIETTRFDWVGDTSQTSAQPARFSWVDDDTSGTSTITSDSRFDWADALMAEDEATA